MFRIALHDEMALPVAAVQPAWRKVLVPSLVRALATVRQWPQRLRQRQALACLDERLLRDVGLTVDQAREEASKPFWRD